MQQNTRKVPVWRNIQDFNWLWVSYLKSVLSQCNFTFSQPYQNLKDDRELFKGEKAWAQQLEINDGPKDATNWKEWYDRIYRFLQERQRNSKLTLAICFMLEVPKRK